MRAVRRRARAAASTDAAETPAADQPAALPDDLSSLFPGQ
jgi:hypothetical protein